MKIPENISTLIPYRPGQSVASLAQEKNLSKIVKLASNENPLGPSPMAISALQEGLADLHRYPDPLATLVREALAKKFQRQPENFLCGHGSDALLYYILNAFCAAGDEVLTAKGTFISIRLHAQKLNLKVNEVPLKDYHYDLKAIKEAMTPKIKVIYLANPNNPTGTMFSKKEFSEFLQGLFSETLIILDEAYDLYAAHDPEFPDGLSLQGVPNVVVLRTFSKAYGLAGLRMGFAYAEKDLIEAILKVKPPFEPHGSAQIAAIAALEDVEFLEKTKRLNQESLHFFRKTFQELGLSFVGGKANFFLLVFSTPEKAQRFAQACLEKGLILRHCPGFGIAQGVRINSGTMEETKFACHVLREVFQNEKV